MDETINQEDNFLNIPVSVADKQSQEWHSQTADEILEDMASLTEVFRGKDENKKTGITLDYSQQNAVDNITDTSTISKIKVLTGGAGFGKTSSVKAVIAKISESIPEHLIFLTCPTGKAAKVLDKALEDVELENRPQTIHRLLGCKGGDMWEFHSKNKLKAKYIIVDESSMVDSELMARLISSVSSDCRFILVGDKAQLPPVGAGCPFRDIIHHNPENVVSTLAINWRQAAGSLIADACEMVISGTKPTFGSRGEKTLGGEREDDFFFLKEDDKDLIPDIVIEQVKPWFNDQLDHIVLAPQKTGVCGVDNLNLILQKELNPPSPEKAELQIAKWLTIREGDKVMHIKNNYGLDVFNGYTGVVLGIDPYNDTMIVDFDGQIVEYNEMKHIKELVLGYCITIHKSQGSQYANGVVVAHSSHYYMWTRQLLYTALSRFKEELVVVGNNKAIKRAINNNVETSRQTHLGLALNKAGTEEKIKDNKTT